MANGSSDLTIVDGSLDFSMGVDSIRTTTLQSESNPGGLPRNQLAWLYNATVRDGGIRPRGGWQLLAAVDDTSALFQGGYMYEPTNGSPYLITSIGGNIFKVDCVAPFAVTNLSSAFGLFNPPDVDQAFFVQAEQFLVIQAGDLVTLPLFWDGTTLRRSIGITNTAVAPGTPGVNEIPAATAMDYYMGRLWYAQGRNYSAGDIVRGGSGTAPYNFKDAVLNVTENPLCAGGDGFTVPDNSGNIRALKHGANLDTALGQGRLFIFTRKAIYALSVPVTRTDWIAADTDNQPLQTVVQLVNGAVNDRSITPANGDLFYQSLEPGIRSLISAIRYFNSWGNKETSANENRVLQFVDRSLMRFGSGVVFDNRLLQATLPKMSPRGAVNQAILPMDFLPISSFGSEASPNWEGMYEGLDFLQLFVGDFGGLERWFGLVVSRIDSSIQLWELTKHLRSDFNGVVSEANPEGESRITWLIETPSFTWNKEFNLKKLTGGELWIDKLYGEVLFKMEWRPDGDPCWYFWHEWKECSARNCDEDTQAICSYPPAEFGPSYRSMMNLPKPPMHCASVGKRPANIGYQFQTRLTVKGYCRIRGIILKAQMLLRSEGADPVC
jgi:hypothetical protein